MNKLLTLLLCGMAANAMANPLTAQVYVRANRALGLHGQTVYLSVQHQASITNSTNQVQYAYVDYVICADNKGCDYSKRFKIKVNPNGTWQDNMTTHMYPTYAVTGNFTLIGKTIVEGITQLQDQNLITIN